MALIASIFQDHAAVAELEVMRVAHSPRRGAMIAVRSPIVGADPVAACSNDRELKRKIGRLLGVRVIYFVRWHAALEQFIANALAPAHPRRIIFQDDPDSGEPIARVVVDEDQQDAADGPDGIRAQLAAVLTRQDIEIILPHEAPDAHGP